MQEATHTLLRLQEMDSTLTAEQRERIEANRRLALERRNERLKLQSQLPSSTVSQSSLNSLSDSKQLNNALTNHEQCSNSESTNVFPHSKPWVKSSKERRKAERQKKNQFHHRKNVLPFGQSEEMVTGNCQLISKDRFSVIVPYHAQLIDIFKSINSKIYDPKGRTWNFSLKDYNVFMKKLRDLKDAVSISGLPGYVLEIFRNDSHEPKAVEDIELRIDECLVESLMPFQRDGICFGITKKGRCLLADDMGLGKTIQALGIAHYYKDDWPLLIVSPSSVRYLWADSIMRWLPSVPYHKVMVMTTSKDYVSDAEILITSYDLMARCQEELKEINFGVFIMDESHFLKSSKTARTKAASVLMQNSKRVIMLSGTPALSRPIELYPQISAINPKLFPSYFEFGIRYCNGIKNQFGWDFSGSSNMQELHLLLESQLMIRRLKSEVISQLPPKLRQMVILNPELVHDKSREMKKCLKNLDQENLTGMERRGALLTYYCATGNAKLKAIQDYISDMLDSEKKFICFAHHRIVVDGICKTVSDKKKDYIRIDGSTDSNARKVLCDKFQLEDKYVAAVLSITAANAGITLTAAHVVVFAELYWNPGILTQAEDRAHRIGQLDSVLVQYLVAKGTADDHLWPLIQNKLNVLNKAGLSKDNFMDTETTVMQNSKVLKSQPSILDYFEEISALDDDEANNMLCEMDLEDVEVQDKKPKLS